MTAILRSKGSLKWYVIACILAVTIGVGFVGFNQLTTTQDKYTAQANAETLAKDITQVCDQAGTFVLNNTDLCVKSENVLTDPTAPIKGPKGDPGTNGVDGRNGIDGKDGKDGEPGIAGKDGEPGAAGKDGVGLPGIDGQPGLNGINGVDGKDGADGTNGTNGSDGQNGQDGQSVTYFSWTDPRTSQKYDCVPDPPGSSSFTCTAQAEPIP